MGSSSAAVAAALSCDVQLGDALLLKREAEEKAQQLEQELTQTRTTANQALQQLLSAPQNGNALHPLNNLANQQVR